MKPPRLSFATVDWPAALQSIAATPRLAVRSDPLAARSLRRSVPPALVRLNAATARRFPGVTTSPVPVLLPFDVEALFADQAAGRDVGNLDRYLSGFHLRTFFFAGPSGYDAAFAIRAAEVPELSELKFSEPFEIHMAASALLYELDDHPVVTGAPVPALEAEFPGIRRVLFEHHLRFTFVRFGVPYAVSIACFNSGVARYRLPTCMAAERVAVRLLRSLRFAGGLPEPHRAFEPLPVERPAEISSSFTYHAPGQLLSGTGFRGHGGRADTTVYSQIRFPLAEAPAFVNSQMFQGRNKPLAPGHAPNYSYPWRDNFCERRGFPVGQCPAGHGHQGQDIRGPRCTPDPDTGRCRPQHDLVAVRDGAILRAPRQEALYLVVNTPHEHLRFRYLHMSPRKMDEDQVFSGRRVREGEVIARIGNFSKREGGTSYHLHFDIQVPTKDGWTYVNPYMTLVAAYERLIGRRGEMISEPTLVAAADPATTGSLVATVLPKPKPVQRPRLAKRDAKPVKRKAQRLARR